MLLEKDVGITQEDKAENGLSVFIGGKMGAGAKHISRMPQVIFQLFEFLIGHFNTFLQLHGTMVHVKVCK